MPLNRIKTIFAKKNNRILLFILIFALAGAAALIISRAATPSVAIEVESGSVTAPATKISDTNASNGQAVTFSQSTPPPTSTTRRFPGDPNPKVSGKAYWGAGIGGNDDPVARHESTVGKSLSIRRTFYQWDSDNNAGNGFQLNGMFSTVTDDHAKNRLPFISFKVPSWPTAAAGGYDSLFDDLFRKLDAYGKPVWVTFNHEPENDGLNAADWRGMQSRIRQRMKAVGTKNVAFMPILMSYTWNTGSGRNPSDWWVDGIWDAYIVDHYCDVDCATKGLTPLTQKHWANFVSWVEAKGLPYGTGEWGNRGTDAQAAQEMQDYWDWGFKNKKDIIAYTYFDSGLNSPNGSWALTGEPLTKFRNILGVDTRVQRINNL